jgi:hypothetical protein
MIPRSSLEQGALMKDSVYVIAINIKEAISLSWEVFSDKCQALLYSVPNSSALLRL